MDRRRLVMTGIVSVSVGAGMLIGAVVFTPGVGFAADSVSDGDLSLVCERVLGDGPIAVAADAIDRAPERPPNSDAPRSPRWPRRRRRSPVVVDAIVADERALDQAVEDGVLTKQADERLRARSRARPRERQLRCRSRTDAVHRAPGPVGFADGPIAAAADAIGVRPVRLLADLRDGSTIADFARAHGVDPSDVVDAVVASLQERLDAAVDNGWISQEQADERSAELREQADALVNGDLAPRFPPRGPGAGVRQAWVSGALRHPGSTPFPDARTRPPGGAPGSLRPALRALSAGELGT
jgi:hypothetical protein